MARFGLLESDSDSDAPSSPPPSSPPSPSSNHSSSDAGEDAPPRESLYDDDDDDTHSGDDSAADDDLSLADSAASSPAQSRTRATRGRTRASSSRDSTAELSRESATPSPPRPRRALPAPSATPQPAWSTRGKLPAGVEPKRVAVMQASLFRQGDMDLDDDIDEDRRQHDTDERDRKRRAVEAQLASRAAPPVPAPSTAAPLPAVDPAPFRPHRLYERTPLGQSATNGREGNLVDAGLALGRSFRVGWGPRGELVSLRGVYPQGDKDEGGSASLKVEKLRLLANDDAEPALRLLKLQLAHTDIFPPSTNSDDDESALAPLAVPSSALRFSHYAELFAGAKNDAKDAGSAEEAQLFKLASVLFDEVPDLALATATEDGAPLTPQQIAYITSLRRRAQLSAWLEDAARPAVESALRALPPSSSGAARIFALLAGHQIERACDAAVESGNLRLATLVAQAGSATATPDSDLQADLALQLAKWREYAVDSPALLDPAYRRVCELLSGNVGAVPGWAAHAGDEAVPEMHVLEGLTWVQALAAGLWYAPGPAQGDEALRAAVEAYERAFASDSRVAAPVPSHLAAHAGASAWAPLPNESRDPPRDAAFHLVKLAVSPVHALESALAPRNFGPAPTDYRLPWHLNLLLSRVLRKRDWEDREVLDAEMGAAEGAEGNSSTADRVTEAYAMQLEALGQWEWAAFVLLHVELEDRRIKAIKNLLARHVDELGAPDSSRVTFLTQTLHIPSQWLASARADAALADPSARFEAYKLLLVAQRAREAHAIAWAELAPEALLRNDAQLVRRLLAPFHYTGAGAEDHGPEAARVAGWAEGGAVFLAYLDARDAAAAALSGSGPALSGAELAGTLARVLRFAERARNEPRTRGLTNLAVAADEMVARLVVLAKQAAASGAPGGTAALERAQPSLLPGNERAIWIQGANRAFWEASFAKAVSA